VLPWGGNMPSPRAALLICAVLAISCSRSPQPGAGTDPNPDSGVAETASGSGPDLPAGCPVGATLEECQRCFDPTSCKRVCPRVDCSVYPPPPECAPVCAGEECCTCQVSFGTEYTWQPPTPPPHCGTACSGLRSAWQALMKDPRMKVCTTDADCAQAGGPSPPSCDCRPAIGGCFEAVNGAAYQSLGAAALERQYLASCEKESRTCDCAPGVPGCQNGACVMKQMFCCLCPPDAGGQ